MNQDPGPWQTPERTCRHVPCSNNQPAFVLCTCIALIYEKNKQQKQWKEKYEAEHTVAARSGAPKPWGRIFNFPPGLIFHGLWLEIPVPIRKSPGECAVRANRKFHRK